MTNYIPQELYDAIIQCMPIVSADTVVTSGHTVLLLKRARNPLRGYWALPGGRLQLGETPLIAAVRRLREEVGIEADWTRMLGEKVVTYFHPGRQNVAITYSLRLNRCPTVTLDGDHAEYAWAELACLPEPIYSTTVDQIKWAMDKEVIH